MKSNVKKPLEIIYYALSDLAAPTWHIKIYTN